MRIFKSGANRDDNDTKIDFEGHLSPLAIKAFGEYMNKHRTQSDGKRRASDNWQRGIPKDVYMKSLWRHFFDVWMIHRGHKKGDIKDALCACFFNISGYLHEHEKSTNKKK